MGVCRTSQTVWPAGSADDLAGEGSPVRDLAQPRHASPGFTSDRGAQTVYVTSLRQLTADLLAALTDAPRLGFHDLQDRMDFDRTLADLTREIAVQLAARNIRMSLALGRRRSRRSRGPSRLFERTRGHHGALAPAPIR